MATQAWGLEPGRYLISCTQLHTNGGQNWSFRGFVLVVDGDEAASLEVTSLNLDAGSTGSSASEVEVVDDGKGGFLLNARFEDESAAAADAMPGPTCFLTLSVGKDGDFLGSEVRSGGWAAALMGKVGRLP